MNGRRSSTERSADTDPCSANGGGPARDRIPVDTIRAPHEPAVRAAPTIAMWSTVLSGPAVWFTHFLGVYLFAEADCAAARTTEMTFLGADRVSIVIAVATVLGVGLTTAAAIACRRRAEPGSPADLYRVGELLAWLSTVAVLLVGVPVLALPVCEW